MEVSGQLHAPAALVPGEEPPVSIGWEAESEVVKRKSLAPAGN
jgi:hypothetical protein